MLLQKILKHFFKGAFFPTGIAHFYYKKAKVHILWNGSLLSTVFLLELRNSLISQFMFLVRHFSV